MTQDVKQVGFRFSCFNPLEEKQTDASCYLRITAIALGAILTVTGVLVLCGVPGLSILGAATGYASVSAGCLALLSSLCIKRVSTLSKDAQNRENALFNNNSGDPADEVNGGSATTPALGSNPPTGGSPDVQPRVNAAFDSSLNSLDDQNRSARDTEERLRLTGLFPEILDASLNQLQSFRSDQIKSLLPTGTADERANVVSLLGELSIEQINILLAKMTGEQLRLLPNKHLQNEKLALFSKVEPQGLSGMLSSETKLQQQLPTTLVNQMVEKLSANWTRFVEFSDWSALRESTSAKLEMPAAILASLTDAQFNDTEFAWAKLSDEQVVKLYDQLKAARKAVIPLAVMLRVLPKLKAGQMISLPDEYVANTSFPMKDLTVDQKGGMVQRKTLDIATVNEFLPCLSSTAYELGYVGDEHLQNDGLDLSNLSKDQVASMFPSDMDGTPSRLGLLKTNALHSILGKMSGAQLALLPDDHFTTGKIDWSKLNDVQIQELLREGSQNQKTAIPMARVNQVLKELTVPVLVALPEATLRNKGFTWSELTDDKVCGLVVGLSHEGSANDRLSVIPLLQMNRILSRMSVAQLESLPKWYFQDAAFAWNKLSADQVHRMFPSTDDKKEETQRQLKLLSETALSYVMPKMSDGQLYLLDEATVSDATLEEALGKLPTDVRTHIETVVYDKPSESEGSTSKSEGSTSKSEGNGSESEGSTSKSEGSASEPEGNGSESEDGPGLFASAGKWISSHNPWK